MTLSTKPSHRFRKACLAAVSFVTGSFLLGGLTPAFGASALLEPLAKPSGFIPASLLKTQQKTLTPARKLRDNPYFFILAASIVYSFEESQVTKSGIKEEASETTVQQNTSRIAIAIDRSDSQAEQSIEVTEPQQVAAADWLSASFPVEDFQTYTSPFGYRQSPDGGYSREFHYGLDLAAPEGSYIRNWWTGVVVEVSDDSNCGTSVVIESGPWLHIYCHMKGYVEADDTGRYMIDRDGGVQIYEGQVIIAGQRIGRVGMTGRTTGPHLHWGLKYEGNWVDPAFVLQAMYQSQQTASTDF